MAQQYATAFYNIRGPHPCQKVSGPAMAYVNLPGIFLGLVPEKFVKGFMTLSKSLAKGNVSCSGFDLFRIIPMQVV